MAGDFELAVLRGDWDSLRLGYAPGPAQAALRALGDAAVLLSLGPAEIAAYDWDAQILTLGAAATARLIDAAAGLKPRPGGVAVLNALKERLGMGSALERALYLQAFAARLGGDFLYGGIFLDAPSQMAIDFPVARVGVAGGLARIALLPVHIPFVQADPSGGGPPAIAEEARRDIEQLNRRDNFFNTWMGSIAASQTAADFRARIRDPRVAALFGAS